MQVDPTPIPITLEQWASLGEDDPGELVGGRLEEEEVPSFVHELLVILLGERFRAWLGPRGLVTGSETRLAVAADRGRKPDLAVWFPGSPRPPLTASISHVPPDVAVEIVTPTPRDARRDRVTKFDEYAAFGVRFYWIVDPELRTVEVYALQEASTGRAYVRALGAAEGAALAVPGIAGASLDLDGMWREVDAHAGEGAETGES
jgi:Uma2 family endonuclease